MHGPSPRQFSRLALASLALSCVGFVIPLLGGLVTITVGHVARYQCRETPGLAGGALALTALVLGYSSLALHLLLLGGIV